MSIDEQALPFALAAVLALVGGCASGFVSGRAKDIAPSLQLDASTAEKLSTWASDASQALLVAITPPITGLTLLDSPSYLIGLAYAVVILIGLLTFKAVLYQRPDIYARRSWRGVTWVTGGGFAINLTAAGVIQAIS